MPLQLPSEPTDLSSLRGIIHAVSVTPLPVEEPVYTDTDHEDDDDSDEDEGAED